MKDDDWGLIYRVHLKGTDSCTKAAWPYMREQKYGSIINKCSASGVYFHLAKAIYNNRIYKKSFPIKQTIQEC